MQSPFDLIALRTFTPPSLSDERVVFYQCKRVSRPHRKIPRRLYRPTRRRNEQGRKRRRRGEARKRHAWDSEGLKCRRSGILHGGELIFKSARPENTQSRREDTHNGSLSRSILSSRSQPKCNKLPIRAKCLPPPAHPPLRP